MKADDTKPAPDFAADAMASTLADEQSLRNWLRAHGHAANLDAGRSGVEVAIGLLSAPPPGTVAALLAKVEEARADAAREAEKGLASSYRSDQASRREAWTEAARLITATLGAPTPLDRAAAEVCGNGATVAHVAPLAAGLSPDDHLELAMMVLRAKGGRLRLPTQREQMAMAARVLLAGMLACDASATKEPG